MSRLVDFLVQDAVGRRASALTIMFWIFTVDVVQVRADSAERFNFYGYLRALHNTMQAEL
jgi:hypothetical protein